MNNTVKATIKFILVSWVKYMVMYETMGNTDYNGTESLGKQINKL